MLTSSRQLYKKTPFNALALWAFVFAAFSILSSSCIYEYPADDCEPAPQNPVVCKLKLEFNTEFQYMTYDYSVSGAQRAKGSGTPVDSKSVVATPYFAPEGEMTYTIHAYSVVDGNLKRDQFKELVFTRNVTDGYDCDATLELLPGHYRIMVWSDFKVDGGYYYNSEDFSAISVDTDPYTGNTDLRDAFIGQTDVEIVAGYTSQASGTVPMGRPLAKYEFVSSGLDQFLQGEGPDATLDDYYAVVSYPQFFPTVFNMFINRPADSLTGISFRAPLTKFANDEVSLGFDYMFIAAGSGAVTTRVAVYRKKDGRLISQTPLINVPLQRSWETVVRGEFLLIRSSDGVGINPDFDGEFNLSGNLEKQ